MQCMVLVGGDSRGREREGRGDYPHACEWVGSVGGRLQAVERRHLSARRGNWAGRVMVVVVVVVVVGGGWIHYSLNEVVKE